MKKLFKRIPLFDLGLYSIIKIFGHNYCESIELHPITNKSVGKRQVPQQLYDYNCCFKYLD